jgi:protein-S-isoprenylcysteine O-methyltransferase Ste14
MKPASRRSTESPLRRTRPDGWRVKGRAPATPRRQVMARWAAVLGVMGILGAIYGFHPYYARMMFEPWQPAWRVGLVVWFLLGTAYVKTTLRRFGGARMNLTDGAMHYLLLFRGVWWWVLAGAGFPRHVWRNRRMRITLLSLGVKAFFTPLMTVFVIGHMGNIAALWMKTMDVTVPAPEQVQAIWLRGYESVRDFLTDLLPRLVPTWAQLQHAVDFGSWSSREFWWISELYYQLIFLVDCAWALTGYALESRWLGNKTKSVEPTGFGWLVALMCYPPFNDVSGIYFPLTRDQPLVQDPMALIAFRVVMLAAFTIYVWATLAFGPTFSNLTNRGIITRGPYKYIRHPAYAAKNLAWWMEFLPWAGPTTLMALVAWNIIYGLRAWTEERHLGRDPAYREYKKRVKWAAIPGIF